MDDKQAPAYMAVLMPLAGLALLIFFMLQRS